jgi:hypothetical protein
VVRHKRGVAVLGDRMTNSQIVPVDRRTWAIQRNLHRPRRATRSENAKLTRSQISGSRLITGQTAYHGLFLLNGGDCIDAADLRYLLKGRLIAANKSCNVPALVPTGS